MSGRSRVVGAWGITVNAVAPGMIDTEMIADLPLTNASGGSIRFRWGAWDGEGVAGVVAFLAARTPRISPGATLDINGGYFMI